MPWSKCFLFGGLFFHVNVFEEAVNAIIRKNLAVKNIYAALTAASPPSLSNNVSLIIISSVL